ncbi:HD domain-containing phosphohydrolase [Calditrichota bacterium]
MEEKEQKQEILQISSDRNINLLLNDVVSRLKEYTESQVTHINKLAKIGVALSSTQDLDYLLEMILDQARDFTRCDAGTLWLASEDELELRATIVQTESQNIRMGGKSGIPVNFPPVLRVTDDIPNNSNVTAYVANSGKMVNIPDVYEVEGFDFQGPRKYDAATGYRTQSMLVFPMHDHEGEIIGVMQLINAKDSHTGETIPFAVEFEELSEALASQAAVAITNVRLIDDLKGLFESFIQVIAAAIDEKSPYTGGHISRVANLTVEIAEAVNNADEGIYADTHFNDDEMYELRLAAWLHDTGKIVTPEHVVDKSTKLQTIYDRMELVQTRFELAMTNMRLQSAQERVAQLEEALGSSGGKIPPKDDTLEKAIEKMKEDEEFVVSCNKTQEFVPDATIERLNSLALLQIPTSEGDLPLLSENELYNLSIRKGNLTKEERLVIENHALVTIKMLEKLPFPKKIKNVPPIAGAHHEKLDGSGYPLGLMGDKINLQARIMALADIFEALTARDRPYKDPKKMSEVLKILGFMVKDNHIDKDVVEFFIENKMHIKYALEHLDPTQLDVE